MTSSVFSRSTTFLVLLTLITFGEVRATDCSQGDAFCASLLTGSYCKYWNSPQLCLGTRTPCSCSTTSVTTDPMSTTTYSARPKATTATAVTTSRETTTTYEKPSSRSNLRTTQRPTTTPSNNEVITKTTSPSVVGGVRFGTYSWSQMYWRGDDTSLIDFAVSDMGRLWNSGDVYVNIADYSNYKKIDDEELLVAWMKQWRRSTGNTGRIFLTYGDASKHYNKRMIEFVNTFENFLDNYVSSEDMNEIAPIGLSFDAEGMRSSSVRTTLENAQKMKTRVSKSKGYAPGSLLIDFAVSGHLSPLSTQYIMELADHATFEVFRNTVGGEDNDGLVERMKWMLTEQCTVCTQPGWENLRAKVTILTEGSCNKVDYCGKVSMCAFDAMEYPSASGGIQYVWNAMNLLVERMISDSIVTTDQFNSLFDVHGTLFAMNNWEWTRCYYGDSFSREMDFQNCLQYHEEALKCRAD